MEKLTYDQIIEILKDNFSIEDFAYNEIPYDTENFSPEALEAQSTLDKWLSDNPTPGYSHPDHSEWYKKYNSLPNKYDIAKKEFLSKLGLNWKEVDKYGGEGQGETWYSVKYFPDHDVYIRVDGYYTSYNGTDFYDGWNCCSEVRPIQKTITVYE